LYLFIV